MPPPPPSPSILSFSQLIVAMVGLPGRGKSFIARSIVRHLDWIGLKSRIFGVKDRRRQEVAMYEPAEYFEAGNVKRLSYDTAVSCDRQTVVPCRVAEARARARCACCHT